MLLLSQIKEVFDYQSDYVNDIGAGTPRDITKKIDLLDTHVKILTGIRRSGKSTVLLQLARQYPKFNFFNFEDPRLSNFDVNDFFKLEKIFEENGAKEIFFFDEIQNVEAWEKYVRVLHDKKKKVVITGSNAKILSKELGTSLTGRQISYEIFPFSFSEFLAHLKLKANVNTFSDYLNLGGMPEYLNSGKRDVLLNLYDDLIYRDIVVRHSLRNPKVVREMGVFLATNTGKEFSFANLTKTFELGSTNTAIAYISYFEDAYMFFAVPRFSYSLKQQAKNPKKIYCVDTGLASNLSMSFSKDIGRLLENMVYIHLRRLTCKVFYYRKKGECDFIAVRNKKVEMVIQVCYELTSENMKREINGLLEALVETNSREGYILTFNQKEEFNQDGKMIKAFPVWEWLLEKTDMYV